MKQSNTALEISEVSCDHNQIKEQSDKTTSSSNNLHTLPFSYEEASDEALVGLYVNSTSNEAFNEIANRYSDMIIGFAMKKCRNNHDAEDIKQDVLLILATKLHTFKGNSKFSTWLYRVTVNTCYKYLKKTNTKCKMEITLEDSFPIQVTSQSTWAKNPDEIIVGRENMEIIGRAVEQLNENNKKIFYLKDINGFSNAEVGESMNLSISAVKSRVLRTRLAIKEKVSNYI